MKALDLSFSEKTTNFNFKLKHVHKKILLYKNTHFFIFSHSKFQFIN